MPAAGAGLTGAGAGAGASAGAEAVARAGTDTTNSMWQSHTLNDTDVSNTSQTRIYRWVMTEKECKLTI